MPIPTPPLPFELPVNAWITLPSGQVLEACLHYTSGQIQYKSSPFTEGVNQSLTLFRLRLVNPLFCPDELNNNTRCLLRILDNSTGLETNYIFITQKVMQSQWKEVAENYGAIIEGKIQPETLESQGNSTNPFT